MFSPLRLMLMTAATVALVGCSGGDDDDTRLAQDLAAPERVDMLAPPVAPDPNSIHPALQIAQSRGLKTNVYFNEELQQSIARLNGMNETLGRLQNDLQGTAMAMQRVEMMRQEIEALNVRFQSLQEKLIYAGPVMASPPPPADVVEGMPLSPSITDAAGTTQTTVTTTTTGPVPAPGMAPMAQPIGNNDNPAAMTMGDINTAPAPHAPQSLTGPMAKPAAPVVKTAQMKPVVDDKGAKASSATTVKTSGGPGVNDVRIGDHGNTVRVVMDVNGANPTFTTDLDNGEKLLTVELPKTKWSAAGTQTIKNNPMIASYSAQPSGEGSVVAFSLKGATKIVSSSTLKSPARIIIDLQK